MPILSRSAGDLSLALHVSVAGTSSLTHPAAPTLFCLLSFVDFAFALLASSLWTVFPSRKVWAVPSFHRKIFNSGDLKGNILTFPLTSYSGQIFSLQCISTSSSLSFSIFSFWNAVCFGRCAVQKGFSPSKYAVKCFVELYKDFIHKEC